MKVVIVAAFVTFAVIQNGMLFTPENITIGKFWDAFHTREYGHR